MACNVLGCREIYLAACPVVSPSCSITHIYTHPTHLGQAPLPLRASKRLLVGVQLLEEGVQALEVVLPKTPVPLQPHLKLLEWRGPQCINSALRVHAKFNQSGITEHPQVLGNLRLAETQPPDHVPDGPWTVEQEFNDLKTAGLGQRSECCHHDQSEYASRRIFLSRHILVREYRTPVS